jgi:hypothetical protein
VPHVGFAKTIAKTDPDVELPPLGWCNSARFSLILPAVHACISLVRASQSHDEKADEDWSLAVATHRRHDPWPLGNCQLVPASLFRLFEKMLLICLAFSRFFLLWRLAPDGICAWLPAGHAAIIMVAGLASLARLVVAGRPSCCLALLLLLAVVAATNERSKGE